MTELTSLLPHLTFTVVKIGEVVRIQTRQQTAEGNELKEGKTEDNTVQTVEG